MSKKRTIKLGEPTKVSLRPSTFGQNRSAVSSGRRTVEQLRNMQHAVALGHTPERAGGGLMRPTPDHAMMGRIEEADKKAREALDTANEALESSEGGPYFDTVTRTFTGDTFARPFEMRLTVSAGVWTASIDVGSLIIEGQGMWEASAEDVAVSGDTKAWVYAEASVDDPSDFHVVATTANAICPVSTASVHVYPLWELKFASGIWSRKRSCLALHDILA